MTDGPPGPPRTRRTLDLAHPGLDGFWQQRIICTLTTLRADGTPHVVPVGATLDSATGLAWVITSGDSVKARNVARAGAEGAPVAIAQHEGRYWCTLEGRATVLHDSDVIAQAEQRYARRYRTPRPNPRRVAIAVRITRILGHLPEPPGRP